MKFLFFIAGFLLLYIIGGRKIAVPYGVALTNNPWIIIFLTTMADTLQIPLFYYLYGAGNIRLRGISKINAKARNKAKVSKVLKWAKRLGSGGIFILSALPSFGGGIWSSTLLAFVLKTNRKLAYVLIASGSLIGITLLAFFSQGIIQLILSLAS